uniref:Putative salivary serpin n=1 Tax=Corethrella appendiculata TaxID=1370023 RepID=U5EVT8_9DIPT
MLKYFYRYFHQIKVMLLICLLLLVAISLGQSQPVFDEGLTKFTVTLYTKLYETNPKENVVVSPYSIRLALGILNDGITDEKTKAMVKKKLRLSDEVNLQTEFSKYKNNKFIKVANNFLVSNDRTLSSSFQNLLSKYGLTPTRIGIDNQNVVLEVNNWIKKASDNLINQIITESDIPANLDMILLNAITFKANWENQFDEAKTKKGKFTDIDGKIHKIDMMEIIEAEFRYCSFKRTAILELPYQYQADAVMWIVLPNSNSSLGETLNVINWNFLNSVERKLETIEMAKIKVPKFTIENKIDIKATLSALGMKKLFSKGSLPVYENEESSIDNMKQNVIIKVNERGTEAGAATTVFATSRSIPVDKFICNRPFLYMILTKSSKQILFIGHYVKPQ